MIKEYSFITVWELRNTSLEEAWKTIKAVDDWPQWWKGVEEVKALKEGDADGIGKVSSFTFKSALPYRLTFESELVQLEAYRLMKGKAKGELEGTGTWLFELKGDVVHIEYHWQVRTTKPWMNLLSPVLKPVFKWNHDVVMQWGLEGLIKRLHAKGI